MEKTNVSAGFVVMAKPVGSLCNLRCTYCYYLDAGKRNGEETQERMSYETLEALIRQHIEGNPGPAVQFNWHGGEPLLAGLDFYKKAVELEKKYLPEGWECWNNIQTNGVLLDDEWCAFLAENHFDIGLSIDGCELVHDRYRLHPDGRGSYEEVARGAELLKKHGILPDLLCTVNSFTAKNAQRVYRGLRSLHTGWIQFIPIVVRFPDGTLAEESVTPEAYGHFLTEVFREWASHDLGKTDVQLFAETASSLAGIKANLCTMCETCGRVLIAEHDGSVYSCDHFVDPAHKIGNLLEMPLKELADLPRQKAFGDAKRDSLTAKCRECAYLSICHGGCLKDRFFVNERGEEGQYYLCEGLYEYFSLAVPVLKQCMEWSGQGLGSDMIMAKVRAEFKKRGYR
ncbi:MAG: anaerobic sulfatase maturase [Lachnospiraceae bacterium]|nr:anaerobic sulfatase maturase [Lachnospiraceae bacterium]